MTMNSELSSLDKKIDQLINALEGARNENAKLRTRLLSLENEKRQIMANVNAVCTRLENLLQKLPEEEGHE